MSKIGQKIRVPDIQHLRQKDLKMPTIIRIIVPILLISSIPSLVYSQNTTQPADTSASQLSVVTTLARERTFFVKQCRSLDEQNKELVRKCRDEKQGTGLQCLKRIIARKIEN